MSWHIELSLSILHTCSWRYCFFEMLAAMNLRSLLLQCFTPWLVYRNESSCGLGSELCVVHGSTAVNINLVHQTPQILIGGPCTSFKATRASFRFGLALRLPNALRLHQSPLPQTSPLANAADPATCELTLLSTWLRECPNGRHLTTGKCHEAFRSCRPKSSVAQHI